MDRVLKNKSRYTVADVSKICLKIPQHTYLILQYIIEFIQGCRIFKDIKPLIELTITNDFSLKIFLKNLPKLANKNSKLGPTVANIEPQDEEIQKILLRG